MADPLFHPSTTHIEVRCWRCGRVVEKRPEDLPAGISEPDFTARAKCECGTGWPEIVRFPKPVSRWGK